MALGGAPSCSASVTTCFCLTCCPVVVVESWDSMEPDEVERVFLPRRFLESRRRRNLEAEAVTRMKVGASASSAGGSARIASEFLPRPLLPASPPVVSRRYIYPGSPSSTFQQRSYLNF